MDVPNVPEVLRLVETVEIECRIEAERDPFSNHDRAAPCAPPTIAAEWRQRLFLARLFLATSAITADTAESVNLPHNRTVIVGSYIDM